MAMSMTEIYDEILKDGGKTPSKKIKETSTRFPDKVAMRYKEFGVWQETTYEDFWKKSNYLSMGLKFFGIEKSDSVAIHSENRPEWFIADIGIQSIGAVSVGLYPTNPASEVEYLLSHSESKILFAEDQEQVDKALQVIEDLPQLEKIVYFEDRGLYSYDHPKLMHFDEFLEIGKSEFEAYPDYVDEQLAKLEDDDVAFLVYTSGTTGRPKGSMITHGNIAWVASQIPNFSLVENVKSKEPQFLSYLPLCHIFGRLIDLLVASHTMATINFAESKRKLEKDFNDPIAKILLGIGWLLSFRTLKKKLGLSKAETAISGAAPIAPEILKFFLALGVPIFEGYGMTENCGFATGNNEKKIKLGTVGVPNHGMEVKLAEDGEVLTRGGAVFKGYFKNEDATKETIDEDGWLHTGDVGVFDGEFLKIVDRKKDIIITSGGKNVSPQEIENKIKISPFIIPHTTYRDLSEKKEVQDLVWKEIIKANEETSSLEIRKFRMIPKELDHEDGELTATQKIKRNVLMEQFSELIEEMYT